MNLPMWASWVLFPAAALFVLRSLFVCNPLIFPSSSIKWKYTKSSPAPFLVSDKERKGLFVKEEPCSNLCKTVWVSLISKLYWASWVSFCVAQFVIGTHNFGVVLRSVCISNVLCVFHSLFPYHVSFLLMFLCVLPYYKSTQLLSHGQFNYYC